MCLSICPFCLLSSHLPSSFLPFPLFPFPFLLPFLLFHSDNAHFSSRLHSHIQLPTKYPFGYLIMSKMEITHLSGNPVSSTLKIYPEFAYFLLCLWLQRSVWCVNLARLQSSAIQTLIPVLPWRYFVDAIKVNTWTTLSKIILDNLSGPDSMGWKA